MDQTYRELVEELRKIRMALQDIADAAEWWTQDPQVIIKEEESDDG